MTVTITRTQRRFVLPEADLPTHYVNIAADLPEPLPPPLHPGTREPIGPEMLAPLFPMELIRQEVSADPLIEIPEEVREAYRIYRPTPLHRATALEKALDTPARIYFKNEGVSPAGSHKPNTAIAQAYYNRAEGVTRLVTETGAGQWGSALAFAGSLFGLETKVFMVKISYEQKPYRRSFIESFGATVIPSPSTETNAGRAVLAEDPDSTGSLGIAISEAIEEAASREDTKYSLGSVLNHVLLHQTVIGQEAIGQMEMAGDRARRRHRLRGWRLELLRHRLPVPARAPARPLEDALPGGRAGILPEPDAGRVPIRLRRYRRHHAAAEDAHARQRLPTGADPRRRAALPRHGADGVAPVRARIPRGARLRAERLLRGGRPVSREPRA